MNKRNTQIIFACVLITGSLIIQSCKKDTKEPDAPSYSEEELKPGGATTVFQNNSSSFSMPAANLGGNNLAKHIEGDAFFEQKFVTAPAPVYAGLGPLFNNFSCVSCHAKDGRGRPPGTGEALNSLLFRLSVVGTDANGGPAAVPGFGNQLQTRASIGVNAEGNVTVAYIDALKQFIDGHTYNLAAPQYTFTNTYQALPSGFLYSPRVAPPIFGLGLLEAVPAQTLLSFADEVDANGDGISGKPNYVWDVNSGSTKLGRFGWKANQPSLKQQNAAAFNGDMGITSPLFLTENCWTQSNCISGDTGVMEISQEVLNNVTIYTQTLGVPARRNIDNEQVKSGKVVFTNAGCDKCHIPKIVTGFLSGVPEVSNQTIFPYTDLLLHDMGPDLADGRPDFNASGSEWRTPPLWGIGLTEVVNGHTNFLHDGRARNIMEAVMWHGGEAQKAKNYIEKLSKKDRDALIAFLNSL